MWLITGLKIGAQELCESRGGRPGLPVPNKPHGFCGRKATLNQKMGSKHQLSNMLTLGEGIVVWYSSSVINGLRLSINCIERRENEANLWKRISQGGAYWGLFRKLATILN